MLECRVENFYSQTLRWLGNWGSTGWAASSLWHTYLGFHPCWLAPCLSSWKRSNKCWWIFAFQWKLSLIVPGKLIIIVTQGSVSICIPVRPHFLLCSQNPTVSRSPAPMHLRESWLLPHPEDKSCRQPGSYTQSILLVILTNETQ